MFVRLQVRDAPPGYLSSTFLTFSIPRPKLYKQVEWSGTLSRPLVKDNDCTQGRKERIRVVSLHFVARETSVLHIAEAVNVSGVSWDSRVDIFVHTSITVMVTANLN